MEPTEETLLCELGTSPDWPHSPHTDPMTLSEAMESLEYNPDATLEIWTSGKWEVVWNGFEEFPGVQPENIQ